jgi:hypothetical protein
MVLNCDIRQRHVFHLTLIPITGLTYGRWYDLGNGFGVYLSGENKGMAMGTHSKPGTPSELGMAAVWSSNWSGISSFCFFCRLAKF